MYWSVVMTPLAAVMMGKQSIWVMRDALGPNESCPRVMVRQCGICDVPEGVVT